MEIKTIGLTDKEMEAKEKKMRRVVCTLIYNGAIEVKAQSDEEAVQIANEMLGKDFSCANWVFGEATADYVEEV